MSDCLITCFRARTLIANVRGYVQAMMWKYTTFPAKLSLVLPRDLKQMDQEKARITNQTAPTIEK